MKLRLKILRALFSIHYFKGRDLLIGRLTDSLVRKPTLLKGDDFIMHLDASEYSQLEILLHGESEPKTLALIRKLVIKGDTVVDVGAHIGHHALVAASRAGRSGHVIAIDPQPYNADRISMNALINDLTNITTICAAAGSDETFVSLPVQSVRDRARLSLHEPGPNDLAVAVEVPLRRLDNIFAKWNVGEVKLLKIDVEGYELDVLRGLGMRIRNCRNIVLEMLDSTDFDRRQTILDLLASAGFVFRDVIGNDWTLGSRLIESTLWAVRTEDL